MPELWILCMALNPLKLSPDMKFYLNSISWTWVIAFWQKKYDNCKRGITPKILMPELWILCMGLGPLKLYPHMKFHFNSISWTWVKIYCIWTEKCDNWQRGITPKILMPELWILCMALNLLKIYPHIKFRFNSISWTWVIAIWTEKLWHSENWQRGITPKILMPDYGSCVWLLTRLSSIHIWSFISIASVELELLHLDRKSVTGRKKCDTRTDRRTDRQRRSDP